MTSHEATALHISEWLPVDVLIRESLRAGVVGLAPPDDLRGRIVARCAVARPAERPREVEGAAGIFFVHALRFLIDMLQVEAACHSIALRGWPGALHRLEVI